LKCCGRRDLNPHGLPPGLGLGINVRLQASRPEAIREILEQALEHSQPRRVVGPHKGASKAVVMAGKELDRLGDTSATEEERQSRKHRILKGPREFREMREDLPKRKTCVAVRPTEKR
jgi:hypothetical protein